MAELEKLGKEELLVLVQTERAEWRKLLDDAEGNGRARTRLGRLDAAEEVKRRTAEELDISHRINQQLQDQQKRLLEENDKTIETNNRLKGKVALLQKDVNGAIREQLATQEATIEKQKEELRRKDQIIADYDKKLDQVEEELQQIKAKSKVKQQKLSATDAQLANLRNEITALRKENEVLALDKEKAESARTQEQMEQKKALAVYQMQLAAMGKKLQNAHASNQSHDAKSKEDVKVTHQHVQTEHFATPPYPRCNAPLEAKAEPSLDGPPVNSANATRDKLLAQGAEQQPEIEGEIVAPRKERGIAELQQAQTVLHDELETMRTRLTSANAMLSVLHPKVKVLEDKVRQQEVDLAARAAEIADYKARRELAANELVQLRKQLVRRDLRGRPVLDLNLNSRNCLPKTIHHPTTNRHVSEAVPDLLIE
jgi:hypothetical protein